MPIQAIDGTVLYHDAAEAQTQLTPHVKAECERRILEIMPSWKQRNVIADLSSDSADTKAAAASEWAKVTALRTKSNERTRNFEKEHEVPCARKLGAEEPAPKPARETVRGLGRVAGRNPLFL